MMIYPSTSIPVTIGGELTSDMVLINKLKLKVQYVISLVIDLIMQAYSLQLHLHDS